MLTGTDTKPRVEGTYEGPSVGTAVIVLEGPSLAQLKTAEARQLAIQAGAMAGGYDAFDSFSDYNYVNPDGTVLDTDEKMMAPGALKRGGMYRQQIVVRKRI